MTERLAVTGCTFTATATWSGLTVTDVSMILSGADRRSNHTSNNGVPGTIVGNTATATWTTASASTTSGFKAIAILYDGAPEVSRPIAQVASKGVSARCLPPPDNEPRSAVTLQSGHDRAAVLCRIFRTW